jgi:thiol-disulfide isomerase/thioredoxin
MTQQSSANQTGNAVHGSAVPMPSRRRPIYPWLLLLLVPGAVGWLIFLGRDKPAPSLNQIQAGENSPLAANQTGSDDQPTFLPRRIKAPELTGGTAWLNTAGPLRLKDLRGKIVILDFWTLCCINCIHTLPELAKLEKKYPNELVVVGVHTPKFNNEKETESIRKAILRYEISHPVVNDAHRRIWDTYGVGSWPSLILIDPEGYAVWFGSGEGLRPTLDADIAELIRIHKQKKTLNDKPLQFELARNHEHGSSPLFFPGKILVDPPSKRIFIADSTHHRIVITDLVGQKIAIAGTGAPGREDGTFAKAQFDDPQGLALHGDTLYVADRKNHLIRALNLKFELVKTIAGSGQQGHDRRMGGAALEVGLNSPWDLLLLGDTLYIAMAGHHQIWTLDLKKGTLAPFAGTAIEYLRDGPRDRACFAQPSGLATDGTTLYVADSETSSIRAIPLDGKGDVTTLVGLALFEFGDHDGIGAAVRLQHALGVAYHDGLLYVADTYNNKIKVLDPTNRSCKTFLGGEDDGWFTSSLFHAPAGICYADGKLYLADTNAHRIRVVDVQKKTVATLRLTGVEAPRLPTP